MQTVSARVLTRTLRKWTPHRLKLLSSLVIVMVKDFSIMVFPALLLRFFIWISLMATGVQCNVTHIVSTMCVVRRSTVVVPCAYTGLSRDQVSAVEWFHGSSGQMVKVSEDPAFEGRVDVVLDAGNCSMLLSDVREMDAGFFRVMVTETSGRKWTNEHGVRVEVTDAEVEVKTPSDVVTEGDWITFICGSCIPSMSVPTFFWRKDGHLHSQYYADNVLNLDSVGLEDGGRYLCTISGHEGLGSKPVDITVRPRPGYAPKDVSVSVRSSGGSVSLTCVSDSNPPALNFSWFQEDQTSAVGSGQTFIISSFSSSLSFYCEAQNEHGSGRSDSVSVSGTGEGHSSLMKIITGGITAAVVLVSITLIIGLTIRRKRATPSEDGNHRGSRKGKTVESPEDTYMSLDPKSRSPEYDTLDNLRRTLGDQESACNNMDD